MNIHTYIHVLINHRHGPWGAPARRRLPCCWFHKCQCRVTHPWTLNPAAAKYYRPIRLAAGFQKRSATPAFYQMQSHMAILIAYHIDMKEDHQT